MKRLLLLGACAIGAYHLVRAVQEAVQDLATLDLDDIYDVWGDDLEEAL